MYEGVVSGIDLGMFGYIRPIEVFLTFYPGLTKGPGSDLRKGKLAIIAFVYTDFKIPLGLPLDPICV